MRVVDPDTGEEAQLYNTPELERDLIAFSKTACVHTACEVRVAVVRGGQSQHRKQCLKCGELIGPAISQKSCSSNLNNVDGLIAERYQVNRERELHDIKVRHFRSQKDKDSSWWKKYNEYLRSPEWERKRSLVLKRANFVCEGCLERPATQAHHLHYRRVFDELLFDLVAVCDECHSKVHLKEVELGGSDDVTLEHPCSACRWQWEEAGQWWCFIFNLSATKSLAEGGPCGPEREGFEALK